MVGEIRAQDSRIISEHEFPPPCLTNLDIHNDRKLKYSSPIIIPQVMATRIVVICKSHLMPGADNVKNAMMANMACQQIWARDFDNSQDRLITEGGYHLYNQTCSLVIDNGPVDSAEQQILVLKWRDQNLYVDTTLDNFYPTEITKNTNSGASTCLYSQ